jgi:hypothetical protein
MVKKHQPSNDCQDRKAMLVARGAGRCRGISAPGALLHECRMNRV